MKAVPTSMAILLIVLISFFIQVPVLADQTLLEWGVLALKCIGACITWYAVFWLIGCLEFLCSNE
jgi:hypothetical protein